MKAKTKSPVTIDEKYLEPLNVNGLEGRMLHLPSKKKKTFVFLSGHHTAHERTYAIAQMLNEYGEVYAPDIPGFGGMNSFYSINMDPTYDAYADYMYTVLKSRNLTSGITLFSVSFGAQIMTRMLQKYPETQDWVDSSVGFVAFGGGQDFNMKPLYKGAIATLSRAASTRVGAATADALFFNPASMKIIMSVFSRAKAKMHSDDDNLRQDMIDMERYLWEVGDSRSHAQTTLMMFNDDIRRYSDKVIDVPFYNIITESDQYIDASQVKKTFSDLYKSYQAYGFESHVHMPSMISSKEAIKAMVPKDVHKLLSKK